MFRTVRLDPYRRKTGSILCQSASCLSETTSCIGGGNAQRDLSFVCCATINVPAVKRSKWRSQQFETMSVEDCARETRNGRSYVVTELSATPGTQAGARYRPLNRDFRT
jgi:hypothetical protein